MPGLVPGIHVLNVEETKTWMAGTDPAMTRNRVSCMHDIRFIRENPEAFDRALARRGLGGEAQRLIALDETRRAAIQKLETAQARRNAASKEIGEAKKTKNEEKANALFSEVGALKETIPALEADEKKASKELDDALAQIPNVPLDNVPDGKDEKDNVEHHHFGAKREYAFAPKQHFDLGEALGQMDFETAAKLSGARFVVLKKSLARLERALGQFMLDVHTGEHGYAEVAPPLLVRDDVMFGTAQLPKFAEDQFSTRKFVPTLKSFDENMKMAVAAVSARMPQTLAALEKETGAKVEPQRAFEVMSELLSSNISQLMAEYDRLVDEATKLWLIPTAEVPLTNLVRESIRDEAELPMRLTACTPCFRAEAGAAGKDTRGMIRQHQFTKVELVSITTPEQSKDEHERMLSCAEEILRRLGLHYRVDDAVHRRHGLCVAKDLRHRGMAARAGRLPGDFLVLGLRRVSGAAHECPLSHQGGPPGAPRAYAQRLRRRRRPRAHRGDGDLSAGRRFDHGAGRIAGLYGRTKED